jgi:pimeloyl-ACP methyl ester carboxylesterase
MTVERVVAATGARLHTESSGSGPALVLIPGGGGDAAMYQEVAPLLAGRHTVLTFDRRGNSRSVFTAPEPDIGVAAQASDVVAILDAYGIDEALVFGSSAGAIIALELIAHHGDRVRAAVAHEPPVVQLLAEDDPARQEIARIGRLAEDRSPMRAFAAFGVMTAPQLPALLRTQAGQALMAAGSNAALALGPAVRRVTGRPPSPMTRMLGNADRLLRHELPGFCFEHRPDLAALRATTTPWRPAVGHDSVGRPYFVAAQELARQLGVTCLDFPGGHTAYQSCPREFADRLTAAFEELAG